MRLVTPILLLLGSMLLATADLLAQQSTKIDNYIGVWQRLQPKGQLKTEQDAEEYSEPTNQYKIVHPDSTYLSFIMLSPSKMAITMQGKVHLDPNTGLGREEIISHRFDPSSVGQISQIEVKPLGKSHIVFKFKLENGFSDVELWRKVSLESTGTRRIRSI